MISQRGEIFVVRKCQPRKHALNMFERMENQSHHYPRSWFKFKPIDMHHDLEGENRMSLG